MIKEIEGNLLQLSICGHFDVIAHGCNCMHTMDAGIAGQIRQIFPSIYLIDKMTDKGDIFKLGEVSSSYIKDRKLRVFNLYTQFQPSNNFEYTAFALALRNMINFLEQDKIFINSAGKIGLPMIGAGIGGGDWNQIRKIIYRELGDYNVTIVKLKQ